MIAGAVQPRPPGVVRQVAEQEDVIFERLKRLQDPRQFTELPLIVRIPMLHHDAVRHIHEHHPHRRLAWRLAIRQRRGHHVEERERNRRPHSFEDCSSWNRFSRDHRLATSSYSVTDLWSCHYPLFDAFLARGCGRRHKAWSGAQRNSRYAHDLPRKPAKRATAIGPISMMMKWRITKSCRPLRGLDVRLRHIPGVPR